MLFIVEMKRSTGAVRGNLLKKLSALKYLLSPAFAGLKYEGMEVTRESFRRFDGDGFYDNMFFFARKAVTAYAEEDVFGLFLDNEDAFLSSIMELAHLELNSAEFIREAHSFVKARYPMSDEDMEDYRTGYAAFLTSVQRGRVILVAHTLLPAAFGLPKRHKSSVNLGKNGVVAENFGQ